MQLKEIFKVLYRSEWNSPTRPSSPSRTAGTVYLQEIEIREIEIRVEFTPARLVCLRRTFASKRMNTRFFPARKFSLNRCVVEISKSPKIHDRFVTRFFEQSFFVLREEKSL